VKVVWGDHLTSTVPLAQALHNGSLVLPHAYAEEGTYQYTVTVTQPGAVAPPPGHAAPKPPALVFQQHGAVTVADAAVTAHGLPAAVSLLAGARYAGPIASFTDANPLGGRKDVTVTVNWGDGTPPAVVPARGLHVQNGAYQVSGSHVFQHPGQYTVSVLVKDKGGSQATATSTFQVTAALPAAALAFLPGPGPYVAGAAVPFQLQATNAPGNQAPTAYAVQYQLPDGSWKALASGTGSWTADAHGGFDLGGTAVFAQAGPYAVRALAVIGGKPVLSAVATVAVVASPSPGHA
jgi:hypothetical protein